MVGLNSDLAIWAFLVSHRALLGLTCRRPVGQLGPRREFKTSRGTATLPPSLKSNDDVRLLNDVIQTAKDHAKSAASASAHDQIQQKLQSLLVTLPFATTDVSAATLLRDEGSSAEETLCLQALQPDVETIAEQNVVFEATGG